VWRVLRHGGGTRQAGDREKSTGDMSDFYLSMADPFFDDWYADETINATSCMYCGSHEVSWVMMKDGRWRLHNRTGGPHICDEFYLVRGRNHGIPER